MAVLKVLFYLIVLILVLVLAYITTRMLGRGMNGRQQSGDMKILDRLAVGRDSYLMIVDVQGRILLVGVSGGGFAGLCVCIYGTAQNAGQKRRTTTGRKTEEKRERLMMKGKRKIARGLLSLAAFIRVSAACGQIAYASDISLTLEGSSGSGKPMDMLDIMFLFLFLAVVPSLLIMMTSFTRIIIVLSFLRNALGTQQSPPNQVMIGLALFLTLFIMSPVFAKVNTQAYEPYKAGEITREEAFTRAQEPMKEFMLKQTEKKSLDLFLSISKSEVPDVSGGPEAYMKLGLTVLVPSFILSELNKAFTMGFLIYIPFLIIDLVVSSTLMSMGMVMLPPTMIALPFKIMMFVLVDGWSLVIKTLVAGFR